MKKLIKSIRSLKIGDDLFCQTSIYNDRYTWKKIENISKGLNHMTGETMYKVEVESHCEYCREWWFYIGNVIDTRKHID